MDYGSLTYSRKGEAAQSHQLRIGSTTVGRLADNDLVLDAEGVAPHHARILCLADGAWLMDLGSSEGTFLNHVRLEPQTRQRLREGDRLRIGPFELRATPPIVATSTTAVLRPEVAARLPTSVPRQVRRLPGNLAARRNSRHAPLGASRYLAYLPPCYHDDAFFGRFLLIFEAILDPIERMIDQLDYYSDPWLAPETLLPWLATWLALGLDEDWPTERRRALLKSGAELYRWRGTRRGLRQYIEIYTGITPQIIEWHQPQAATLALPPHSFLVLIEAHEPETIDAALVEAIIQAEKPAHASYRLRIQPAQG